MKIISKAFERSRKMSIIFEKAIKPSETIGSSLEIGLWNSYRKM